MRTITYQTTTAPPKLIPFYDAPSWKMGQSSDDSSMTCLDEVKFEDRLVIVGTLKPIWKPSHAIGEYRDHGDVQFLPVPLYENGQALERIEWIAQWIETLNGGIEALSEPFSWGIDFNIQTENVTTYDKGPLLWGGVYYLGCALSEIRQNYFTLSPDRIQTFGTSKRGYTKINWHETTAGQHAQHEQVDDQSCMTFQNHIQFGSLVYFMPDVGDSIGYQSTEVLDYDPENGRIKLLFLRRNHGNTLA